MYSTQYSIVLLKETVSRDLKGLNIIFRWIVGLVVSVTMCKHVFSYKKIDRWALKNIGNYTFNQCCGFGSDRIRNFLPDPELLFVPETDKNERADKIKFF